VGFEPTIPVFEQAKTVPALYRAAVIGQTYFIPEGNQFGKEDRNVVYVDESCILASRFGNKSWNYDISKG
jgi:hypothetical protein